MRSSLPRLKYVVSKPFAMNNVTQKGRLPMRDSDEKGVCAEPAADALVDIRDVTVDKSLPREERIAEFVRQIKNPYCFRCGEFIVHTSFANAGPTLEDCMMGILR
jgi:hypothetical protein